MTYIPDLKSTSILKEKKLRGCDQNQKHTTCLGCQIKVPETSASDSSSIIIKIRHFIRVCKTINLRIRKSYVIKSIDSKISIGDCSDGTKLSTKTWAAHNDRCSATKSRGTTADVSINIDISIRKYDYLYCLCIALLLLSLVSSAKQINLCFS